MSRLPVRIGFDVDGVLADFASAYRDVGRRLFGADAPGRTVEPEHEEEAREQRNSRDGGADRPEPPGETPAEAHPPHEMRRRQDLIWKEITATTDFWASLKPIEPDAVRRIYELALRHRWDVVFITQRPPTHGASVQRQTQRWLVEQGFDLPSVLHVGGSRGAAAAALRLGYHVDDNPQNCIEVRRLSSARPLLIVPDDDPATAQSARRLGIGVASSLSACLDILDEATSATSPPGVLDRLAAFVGWH
jgi:hypothetical protein